VDFGWCRPQEVRTHSTGFRNRARHRAPRIIGARRHQHLHRQPRTEQTRAPRCAGDRPSPPQHWTRLRTETTPAVNPSKAGIDIPNRFGGLDDRLVAAVVTGQAGSPAVYPQTTRCPISGRTIARSRRRANAVSCPKANSSPARGARAVHETLSVDDSDTAAQIGRACGQVPSSTTPTLRVPL
jgi:hypothetical protein